MPLTQLDPVVALVTIDLQKGIVGHQTVHPAQEIIENAAMLANAFREHGLPVVIVNVTGSAPGRTDSGPPKGQRPADWTEVVPQLRPQAGEFTISKQRWGAFIGTELNNLLHEKRVTQIVLAGIATSLGVESTARSAFDAGYNVVLVTDAMTDRDPEMHRHAIEKVFPRLGQTTTTQDVLTMLKARPRN